MGILTAKHRRMAGAALTFLLLLQAIGLHGPTPRAGAATATWSAASSGTSDDFIHAAYGNGKFLLLLGSGDYGWYDETNGWAKQNEPLGHPDGILPIASAYTGSKWVVVGADGQIRTTVTGASWDSASSGVSDTLSAIAYRNTPGSELLVAAGYSFDFNDPSLASGKIFTSSDGTSWNAHPQGTGKNFTGIAYGENRFIAVGYDQENNNFIYSSSDGVSWSPVAATISQTLYSIGYGNGVFVAVGLSGYILTSDDGVIWQDKSPAAVSGKDLFGVTYGAGKFYAVGANETIISSIDGSAWATEHMNNSSDKVLTSIAAVDGQGIAVGNEGLLMTADVQPEVTETADLTSLVLSGSPSGFSFVGGTYVYNGVTVANAVGSITVTPTGAGTIAVDGTPVTSGSASDAIALTPGVEKTITVVATEPGKTAKTYTIQVTREMAAQPTPTFNPAGGAVAFGTELEIVSADADHIYYTTNGDTPATSVGGSTLEYDPASKPVINAAMTVRAIAVRSGYVTSAVGSASFTQAATADLTSLVLSGSPSGFSFVGGTYSYTGVTVPTSVNSITVTPTGAGTITVDGTAVASGSASSVIPLRPGIEKTITIVVEEPGKTAKTYTVRVTRTLPAPANPPAAPAAPPSQTHTAVEVLVNGKVENAGTATTSQQNGKSVTTIAVDEQKLEQRLSAEGRGAVITIPVNTGSDVVVGELNGQMVKNMESRQAVVEIRTASASYTLPAKQINIDDVSIQVGSNVELEEIKVRIEIAEPDAEAVRVVQQAASDGNFTLVVPALEFTVRAAYGDRTVEVSKFNAYVERTVAIPEGVDPNRITTGVVVEPDGTVRHVPTKVIQTGGRYYARINSLTNSTYSVVWHPLTFDDASRHWAKDAVNDMGSRMIVNGFGDGEFRPNQDMTRAEFAAVMVRGLGLRPENGRAPFSDVEAGDWFNAAVRTASSYGLISGFEDGTFRPGDKITREQAIVIIAKATAISGLKDKLQGQETVGLMNRFADADAVAEWAKTGVAEALLMGIVTGRGGKALDPKSSITRAEVAVLVRNLLLKSELI